MNVEIWHKLQVLGKPTRFVKGQILHIFSVSDENTCELAYLHTCNASLTQLQNSKNVPPSTGDIFVLRDDDAEVSPRCYEITLVPDGETPLFSKVTFDSIRC